MDNFISNNGCSAFIDNSSYKAAYEKEKLARLSAEKKLEEKTNEITSNLNLILSQYNELLLKNKELDLLMSVANVTQKQLSLTDTLKQFISLLGEVIQTPYLLVYLFKKKTQKLKPININWSEEKFSNDFFNVISNKQYGLGEGIPGQVLKQGQSLKWKGEKEIDPIRSRSLSKYELEGCYAFPIKRYGQVIAVIEVGVKHWTTFQQALIDKVDSAAIQLSVALERRQAQKDTEANLTKLKKTLCDLKSAQNQLVQTEKLASLGQLAAGVVHEINNPIGFVLSNVETLEEYVGVFTNLLNHYKALGQAINSSTPPSTTTSEIQSKISELESKEDLPFILTDIQPMLDDSKNGLNRVKEIVNSLKSFARADENGRTLTNINDCIKNTLRLVWNELKYNSTIETELSELPPTVCNAGQIEQVLMNLFINAGQACTKDGQIYINTSIKDNFIIILVSDNGCGMTKETLNKVFDPFYTTKPIGVGTGLGLSISYGIMEKHNGKIIVESEKNKGTSFSLFLPIIDSI